MGNINAPTILAAVVGATTATTASRAWVAKSLIFAVCTVDYTSGTAPVAAMSSSGGSITWANGARANTNPASNGGLDIWVGYVVTGFTGTITATNNNSGRQITLSAAVFTSSGADFNSTPLSNRGAVTNTNKNTLTTAFTTTLTTTAPDSWTIGGLFNFTRFDTATANASSVIGNQGNTGAGDTYALFMQSSLTVQPTVSSGTGLTLGVTFPSSAVGQVCLIELLDPGTGGSFTGSAATTATLTGAAAGVVNRSTGAASTLALTGAAAGVVGVTGDAAATLSLTAAADGSGSQPSAGASATLALGAVAAGVVGASSGTSASFALTLAAVAAGVVGTSTGAAATLALAGVAAGVASAPGGNATATLNLAGVATGQIGATTGATAGVALAGVAAGIVGKSSGATLTLTLAGLATGANTRTGTADTTLTLTGAADGVVGGGGGNAAAILELIAEASGTVTGLGARTFTPDLPDWTRENTAAIVYSETKTIGPFEQVIFGLIGVGSYTINTHTDTINQGIRLLLSYQATLDPNSGIAVAVLSVDGSPISAQYVGYESPSYGGQLSIYNQDPTQSYEVTVWSSNRVVTTPRYLGDLLPSRLFGSPVGLTSGVDVFVQPGDYVTFGYCANVLTGLYIDSPVNGTLWFQYLAATGPPFRVAVATVVGGTPQLITVPLPFAQGNFYFTPSATDPAGRIIVQAFPARNG